MVAYATFVSTGMLSRVAEEIKTNDAAIEIYEQHSKKPAIDDVICHYLDGSTLKNALNFIDYVRASKMKIKWAAANVWSVRYKNKHVLDIVIREDSWRVRLVLDNASSRSIFSKGDAQYIDSMVGVLRDSMSEHLDPTPALS